MEVSAVLGASSQSLEEAYLTEVRMRMSEEKGRAFLINKVKEAAPQKLPRPKNERPPRCTNRLPDRSR